MYEGGFRMRTVQLIRSFAFSILMVSPLLFGGNGVVSAQGLVPGKAVVKGKSSAEWVAVTNETKNQISVVDPETGEGGVFAIPHPTGILFSKDQCHAYVVCAAREGVGGGVSILNTKTGRAVKNIALEDPKAMAITPDGKFVFVADSSSSVSVIDTGSLKVVKELSLSDSAEGMAVSPDSRTLYVMHPNDPSITVVDLPSFQLDRRISIGTPSSRAVVSPDGQRLYVASYYDSKIHVVDTANNLVVRSFRLSKQDNFGLSPTISGLAMTADGKELVVSYNDKKEGKDLFDAHISMIDTGTGKVKKPLKKESASCARGVAFSLDGQRVYAVVHSANKTFGGNQLVVIDVVTHRITKKIGLGEGTPAEVAVLSNPLR
jgi:YVTN family beta-propeller protein